MAAKKIQMVTEEKASVTTMVKHIDGDIDTTLYFNGKPIVFTNGEVIVSSELAQQLKDGGYIQVGES